jgi:rhodanese-related sulfurtransferase
MSLPNESNIRREIYDQLAQFGKAFGSARRLQVLELLAQAEYTVEQLAAESGMSVANTSQHLKVLRANRLVEVRRQGVEAYYRPANEQVFQVWEALRSLAERQIAEIERLGRRLHGDEAPDFVSFGELEDELNSDQILLIDVRPVCEYRTGHIPGAMSIPLEEIENELPDIDRDTEVIVYCRGPYSTLSGRAVSILLAHGFLARQLEKGYLQWQAAGLPVVHNHLVSEMLFGG